MNAFLISYNNETSEWLNSFNDVQLKMNDLEKSGIVSNVKVMRFEDNLMVKSFVYNYNGVNWEK